MTDWASLGTPPPGFLQEGIASNFPIAANQDGHLEVFSFGADSALWHVWQDPNGPNNGWSNWASLGRPPEGLSFNPAVGVNANGHLEVFGIGAIDKAFWHIWQDPNGPNNGWTDWASLGGPPDSFAGLTVAANADGHLEVFASASGYGRVWHMWQDPNGPNNGWSNWASLDLPPGVVPPKNYFLGPVTVGRNQNGRLEVFATSSYNGGVQWAVWHVWQDPNGPNNGWSNWESLDFLPIVEPGLASPPVVKANLDGRLEVFLTVGDGSLWHRWQSFPSEDVWNNLGWVSLGKPTGQIGQVASAYPALGANNNGRLEAFIKGSDNALWHVWQDPNGPNNGWSNWASLGIPPNLTSTGYIPSVGVNADGRLEVFINGSDNALWHAWQTIPHGGWG
jgi:hypothetical protein